MVIVTFEVVCPVLFSLHDRENQLGEPEPLSNIGRSGFIENFGQGKVWIVLFNYGT